MLVDQTQYAGFCFQSSNFSWENIFSVPFIRLEGEYKESRKLRTNARMLINVIYC